MGNFVNFVNTGSFTWKADIHPRFRGLSLADVGIRSNAEESSTRRLLGKTNNLAEE
jgi:hypothetical protein